MDDDSKNRFAERIRRTLAGEKIDATVDFRVRKKDESFMYVTLNISFSQEKPHTALVIAHDITERKMAEEALKESEHHYHSLFENMIDGYAYCRMIFDNDQPQDFVYLSVNKSFETLTGLKDVTGKRVTEVIPGIKETNPELIETYWQSGFNRAT